MSYERGRVNSAVRSPFFANTHIRATDRAEFDVRVPPVTMSRSLAPPIKLDWELFNAGTGGTDRGGRIPRSRWRLK